MSVNGLFWNVGGADRSQLIAEAAVERNLNVVVLAESGASIEQMSHSLEMRTRIHYSCPGSKDARLQVFSRSPSLGLEEVHRNANGRLTVRRLVLNGKELLLGAAHLVSKQNWGEASQHYEAQVLAGEIRDVETRQGHRRTILVGDLNLNPFEHGVVAAAGLHAMMSKTDVAVGSRIVQDKEYPFFYNPMWGVFGDRTPGPPGSFYYRAGEQISYDWNLFDQFLIRPDALALLDEHVELLTRIAGVELATPLGRPNREIGSDHFPLLFCLKKKGAPRNDDSNA